MLCLDGQLMKVGDLCNFPPQLLRLLVYLFTSVPSVVIPQGLAVRGKVR